MTPAAQQTACELVAREEFEWREGMLDDIERRVVQRAGEDDEGDPVWLLCSDHECYPDALPDCYFPDLDDMPTAGALWDMLCRIAGDVDVKSGRHGARDAYPGQRVYRICVAGRWMHDPVPSFGLAVARALLAIWRTP